MPSTKTHSVPSKIIEKEHPLNVSVYQGEENAYKTKHVYDPPQRNYDLAANKKRENATKFSYHIKE